MLKNIGSITIKSLRDFILENGLTDNDTITLHQHDFDEIVLEYRETYEVSISIPYLLLGVLIKEETQRLTPKHRIRIIENDTESQREPTHFEEYKYYSGEVVYRCGWCGNIVDEHGAELYGDLKAHKINIIEKFGSKVTVKSRHGKCCPNGHKK